MFVVKVLMTEKLSPHIIISKPCHCSWLRGPYVVHNWLDQWDQLLCLKKSSFTSIVLFEDVNFHKYHFRQMSQLCLFVVLSIVTSLVRDLEWLCYSTTYDLCRKKIVCFTIFIPYDILMQSHCIDFKSCKCVVVCTLELSYRKTAWL